MKLTVDKESNTADPANHHPSTKLVERERETMTNNNKTEITLKGSVDIVSDFFFTAINSILYQRGKLTTVLDGGGRRRRRRRDDDSGLPRAGARQDLKAPSCSGRRSTSRGGSDPTPIRRRRHEATAFTSTMHADGGMGHGDDRNDGTSTTTARALRAPAERKAAALHGVAALPPLPARYWRGASWKLARLRNLASGRRCAVHIPESEFDDGGDRTARALWLGLHLEAVSNDGGNAFYTPRFRTRSTWYSKSLDDRPRAPLRFTQATATAKQGC